MPAFGGAPDAPALNLDPRQLADVPEERRGFELPIGLPLRARRVPLRARRVALEVVATPRVHLHTPGHRLEPMPPGMVRLDVGIVDPVLAQPRGRTLANLLVDRVAGAAAARPGRVVEQRPLPDLFANATTPCSIRCG